MQFAHRSMPSQRLHPSGCRASSRKPRREAIPQLYCRGFALSSRLRSSIGFLRPWVSSVLSGGTGTRQTSNTMWGLICVALIPTLGPPK